MDLKASSMLVLGGLVLGLARCSSSNGFSIAHSRTASRKSSSLLGISPLLELKGKALDLTLAVGKRAIDGVETSDALLLNARAKVVEVSEIEPDPENVLGGAGIWDVANPALDVPVAMTRIRHTTVDFQVRTTELKFVRIVERMPWRDANISTQGARDGRSLDQAREARLLVGPLDTVRLVLPLPLPPFGLVDICLDPHFPSGVIK
jgi:hypothetical protein